MSNPSSASHTSPFTGTSLPRGTPFWIVDGVAYDFSAWMKRHPGGAIWFRYSQGRDISAIFHVYHRDPERLRKILVKYRIDGFGEKDVLPKMGIPPFLLAPDFDASKDIPKLELDGEGTLLNALRGNVASKLSEKVLCRYDLAFDMAMLLIALAHATTLLAIATGWLAAWACVFVFLITRTALAGAGHYYVHRKKRDGGGNTVPQLGQALFDINYVGTCLTAMDGHVLLHHGHMGTGADVKRTFFDGMLRLHPLLRIPGYTLHKLGMSIIGVVIRGFEITFFERDQGIFRLDFWFIRIWLLVELAVCVASGHLLAWLAQFCLCLWFNTFLVLSSHGFEDQDDAARIAKLPARLRNDWAARHICLSYDLCIVGNRWVDVLLTAGLSPHRVHHVLPAQRSGFANIASESAVRESCIEAGIDWERPRNVLTERIPAVIKHYLLAPPKRRQSPASPSASPSWLARELGEFTRYCFDGWRGLGI